MYELRPKEVLVPCRMSSTARLLFPAPEETVPNRRFNGLSFVVMLIPDRRSQHYIVRSDTSKRERLPTPALAS